MKTKFIALIIGITIIAATAITTTIILYNYCPDCDIPPPPNNNGNNDTISIWREVYFTLINESVLTIYNYSGNILLLEFAKSGCPDCSNTIPELKILQEYIINNSLSVSILTLMVDLDTPKDLLTYYIDNDLTWNIGWCNQGNYSKLSFDWVPTFFAFNSTSHEINKQVGGTMDFNSLLDFLKL